MPGLIKPIPFEVSAQKILEKAQKASDSQKRQKLLKKALFGFVENADLSGLEKAIKAGADVNAKTDWGLTPLMCTQSVEISLALLKADANIEDLDLNTTLSPQNKLEIRKQYQDYLKSQNKVQTPKASSLPDKKTQAILDFDNVPDVISMKLLELIAKKELKQASMTSDTQKQQDLLQSALFHFMEISDIDGMDKAVKAGADVNLKDDLGNTLVMVAASPKTTLFALEHGGKIEDLDFNLRLKPKQKMITRREFERRKQEKTAQALYKKDSREI